jgi:hypothetical protein
MKKCNGFQKIVSMFVIFIFCTFLNLTAYPPQSQEKTDEQRDTHLSQTQEKPGVVEGEGTSGSPSGKHSILPIVLIGAGVVAVAALLFLVVLKKKAEPTPTPEQYNIVGTWSVIDTFNENDIQTYPIVCTGTKDSGTFILPTTLEPKDNGTYTVNGSNISFSFVPMPGNYFSWEVGGSFIDANNFSASYNFTTEFSRIIYGTWRGTRTSSTTSALPNKMTTLRIHPVKK